MASPIQSPGSNPSVIAKEILLQVEHVSKRFGAFYAVQDATLHVPQSTLVLLMGPNGSGKTTLINCISGVYAPDAGSIRLNGTDITGRPPHEIVGIGLGRSFQIPGPFKQLTVAENLLVCGRDNPGEMFLASPFKRTWEKYEASLIDKMLKILQVTGLSDKEDMLAGELSGGQLKLLELGRLLMLDVKMMLLDEPIGGVNPVLAHSILSYIQQIRGTFQTSFLIVEHRLDIVMKYVDLVYVLAKGSVLCSGSPDDVVRRKELYDVYLT
jgi:branched-chain amino acid transport system ATP-binding protein